MKPVVNRLEKLYEGKVDIKRLKADAPETQALAEEFGIQYVPTFVFVDSKGNRTGTVVGAVPIETLTAKLDALR